MTSLLTPYHQEKSPISSDGLNIFLQTLVKARCGACPLLEVSLRQVMVPTTHFFGVVDYVFHGCLSFERERIKTEIFDQFGGSAAGRVVDDSDEVDLEVALEYVLMQYDEMTKRWDSRLESLFAANDSDGNGNLDLKEFQAMCMCLCVCLWVSLCVRSMRVRSRVPLMLKLIYSRTEYDAQAQRELVELSGSIHGQFAHVRKHVHFSSCGRLGLLQNCQKVSVKCFHARQWL